jgi:hypothetical protein
VVRTEQGCLDVDGLQWDLDVAAAVLGEQARLSGLRSRSSSGRVHLRFVQQRLDVCDERLEQLLAKADGIGALGIGHQRGLGRVIDPVVLLDGELDEMRDVLLLGGEDHELIVLKVGRLGGGAPGIRR